MNLLEELINAPKHSKDAINKTIVEASLVYQLGGNWRRIFKKARRKSKGNQRRIFKELEDESFEYMEIICNSLSEGL